MNILFSSWHFYLDQSNGASISTRELLLALSRRGWKVTTFCGSALDNASRSDVRQVISARGLDIEKEISDKNFPDITSLAFHDAGIDSIVFCPKEMPPIPSAITGEVFLKYYESVLKQVKPDVVVSYGGFGFGSRQLALVHANDAKTVVLLHNLAYRDVGYFQNADLIVVPSLYAADVYRKRLGIEPVSLPPLIDSRTIISSNDESAIHDKLLFVNPSRNKGVCLLARIVTELWRRRPEIPILVVEGDSGTDSVLKRRLDGTGVKNVQRMKNTVRPDAFYRQAKVTLVPSFCEETFGRVAAESMMTGVPVLASTRGALPETIGDAGVLLDVPERCSPETNEIPTVSEAEPWIDAILRLWDDDDYYAYMKRRGLEHATIWDYEFVSEQYEEQLKKLL